VYRSELQFHNGTAITMLPTADCKYLNLEENTVTYENKNDFLIVFFRK